MLKEMRCVWVFGVFGMLSVIQLKSLRSEVLVLVSVKVSTTSNIGAWDGVVVKALHYLSDGHGIDSRWCQWIFQWHSFWPYHGPGVDSAPSENEYQEHFLGVKAAGAWGWEPHHLQVPNVMKIWELKPPATLWATSGLLRDSFTFYL